MPKITTRKRSRIPISTPKSRQSRVLEAYERLGITKEEVDKSPVITTVLKVLDGGTNSAISFLRSSHEPDARKFLDVYDSLPISVRTLLPIEAFCVAANLTTKRVLEVVTGSCFEQSANVAELISRSARPKLVGISVKQALKPKNFDERKMVLQHEGYAPVPKTQVVNVQGGVNTDNRIQSVSITELGGVEKEMARINDRFNERLGIGAVEAVEVVEQPSIEGGVENEPTPEPTSVESTESAEE